MLNKITWVQYLTFIIVVLIVYYGYVFIRYYNYRFFNQTASINTKGDNLMIIGNDILASLSNSISDEINSYLEQAGNSQIIKPEIIFSLQQITAKYERIKSTTFQKTISSIIQMECLKKCAIHLSDEEIRQVWLV
jgi:hypothetical protein